MSGDVVMVQGSAAPVFSGEKQTDEKLVCSACNMLLIENYEPTAYFGFGIQCYHCKAVTRLPSVPDGDILPKPVLSFGSNHRFLVTSVCKVPPGVVIATDCEISKQEERTSPKDVKHDTRYLENLIAEVEAAYEQFTGRLDRETRKIERAMASANAYAAEIHPLVWSVVYLRKRLREHTIDIDNPADIFAIASIVTFHHMLAVWKDHPRFAEVSGSLADRSSFNHHMAVLTTASYLHKVGNSVTLNETQHGTRTADLYVKSGTDTIAVEVKAPLELHWPRGREANMQKLENTIRAQLKRARGQIDREHPGILVIASGVQIPEMGAALKKAAENVLAEGGAGSGVIGITLLTQWYDFSGSGNELNAGLETWFDSVTNPKYAGSLRLVNDRPPWSAGN